MLAAVEGEKGDGSDIEASVGETVVAKAGWGITSSLLEVQGMVVAGERQQRRRVRLVTAEEVVAARKGQPPMGKPLVAATTHDQATYRGDRTRPVLLARMTARGSRPRPRLLYADKGSHRCSSLWVRWSYTIVTMRTNGHATYRGD
ncbi:hypothetical protein B296_00023973 [Ensete ventricosum]|uniref:Uncharacterized protein n=1 Tax=Ensete ventricosum TaxID=4639 RepID=A0A426Y476_ENSVE|nr:hypothetical protein B296_00023973 [Ensete ventricosum]